MFEDTADFARLSYIPLKVSKVLQKVFIEVNEEGSEAAAATGNLTVNNTDLANAIINYYHYDKTLLIAVVEMRLKRMAVLSEEFIVDRPFMFAIEHKPSKMLLFLGSVRKIESSQERDEL